MSKIRLLLLDVEANKPPHEVELERDSLQEYYDALKCECFDITHRNIGGKGF